MVTSTYAPHPVNAGITPALTWGAKTLLSIAVPALAIAVALPWLARNHSNPTLVIYAIVGLAVVEVAWVLTLRRLRESIRFHVPGAMRKEAAPPRALDLLVAAVDGTVIIAAIWIAFNATQTMGEVATFLVAFTFTFIGATGIPFSVRYAYRIGRNHDTGRLRHTTSLLLHATIPAALAFTLGWGLFPDRLAGDGRSITVVMIVVATMCLTLPTLLKHITAPPKPDGGNETGTRPARTITITHTTSPRDMFREAGDSIGDAVLSWADAAPSLEDRDRARHMGRVGLYSLLALVALLMFALMFL